MHEIVCRMCEVAMRVAAPVAGWTARRPMRGHPEPEATDGAAGGDPPGRAIVPPDRLPRHFYSLDALRGIAALTVVLTHWKHFFYPMAGSAPFSPARQPLYWLLEPFYAEGWRAVDLFFCLSGFIFFWLYRDRIAGGAISFREFAVLRFSRLYPLHLATLLLVAAGQWLSLERYGSYFVYPYNDTSQFALHLVFASSLNLRHGLSFNGPVWTVSVEVALYLVFFAMCRLGMRRWQVVACVLAGIALIALNKLNYGRGLFSFFVGGMTFHAVRRLHRGGSYRRALPALVACTSLAWLVVPSMVLADLPSRALRAGFPACDPSFLGRRLIPAADLVGYLSFGLVVFPLTIMTLALLETRRGGLGRRLSILGDISYSSYMIHFPLQLGFVLVGSSLSPGGPFYDSPASLALFFGVLVPLSLASYRFVERPAQTFLRARLMPRRLTDPVIASSSIA